ncbi:MAG: S41 family peptidase [Agathobacter sp.]|nr:S41 family peptidase [Agathobacter sp.]
MQYNNEIEDLAQVYAKEEPENKESVWKKYGFFFGVLTTILCLVVVCFVIKTVLNMTGQLLVIGKSGASTINGDALLDSEVVEKIDEIYSYMNIYYYGDFEKEDIHNAIYSGVVESLEDPYSVYYTPEEYKDMQVSTSGTYYGIGAGVSQDLTTMEVTISKVYRGTPSEEAGLKNGDKLLSVEGIEATSVEVSELVKHIRGEEGTTVHLVIYRPSTEETLEFDVERRYVELPSIEGEILEDGIAYIQITEFQDKTDEQFADMVKQLQTKGVKGLIIDVRANPGGMLTTVVNLLDQILPKGLLVYVEDKYGNRDEYNSDATCLNLPIVVLVDEHSASASEIFAGAMKDYEYATIVGKTTYGKGVVQNVIRLSDGDALKITTAKYFTPKGKDIHKVGVAPDVEVEYEYSGPEGEDYNKQYDSQFLKALEIMKEKLANE